MAQIPGTVYLDDTADVAHMRRSDNGRWELLLNADVDCPSGSQFCDEQIHAAHDDLAGMNGREVTFTGTEAVLNHVTPAVAYTGWQAV